MLKTGVLIILFASVLSCVNPAAENESIPPTETISDSAVSVNPIASNPTELKQTVTNNFLAALENEQPLHSFFARNWSFIYHVDNRCDGSTDGKIDQLPSTAIDTEINLEVHNDGEGWAYEKTAPKDFTLKFDLKKQVATWDRFEILEDGDALDRLVYLAGGGQSDFLTLVFDQENKIVQLSYFSEDPG